MQKPRCFGHSALQSSLFLSVLTLSHLLLDQLRQNLLYDLLIQPELFLNGFLELDLEVVVLEVKLGQRDVFSQALYNWVAILIRKFNATVTHRNSANFETLAD